MRFAPLTLFVSICICGCAPEKPAREAPPPLPKGDEPPPTSAPKPPDEFGVSLSEAAGATALDKTVDYAIFLNVNSKGPVVLSPTDRYKDSEGNEVTTIDNRTQVAMFLNR